MLMSAGVPLPRQVFGHGFVTFKGEKMSKSLGTSIDPLEAASKFGPDPLRLYLVREFAYGQDGDFSWERFEERYNVDLANNLGNLVSRVTAMVERYRGGALAPSARGPGALAAAAAGAVAAYRDAMERYALHEAAASAFRLVDATNEFIAASEPWALARAADRAEDLTQLLYDSTEALRVAAVLLLPVMPDACADILSRVGEPTKAADLRFDVDAAWKAGLGRAVVRAPALWPRLDLTSAPGADVPGGAPARIHVTTPDQPTPPPAPAASAAPIAPPPEAAAPQPPAAPERLSIDEFMKVELRVARILSAERVPKSKKLLKFHVDLGTEQRTLVAGIAEAYEPEALVGRTVVMVANLKPATLMGIESNGMVLAASPEGGRPQLLSFEGDPPAPGTRVR
jgi:methionyl-tRNA synthetase